MLGNLVINALKYGAVDSPVRIALNGTRDEVLFAVKNRGPMIEPSSLMQIFDPLKRGPEHQEEGSDREGSLGLGRLPRTTAARR